MKKETIIAAQAKERQKLSDGQGIKGMSKSTDLNEPILTRAAAAKDAEVGQTKFDEGKLIIDAVASGEADGSVSHARVRCYPRRARASPCLKAQSRTHA